MRPRVLLALLFAMSCHPAAEPPCSDCAALEADTKQWRDERVAGLRGEHGWLALAGLFWLEQGEAHLGSDADIPFPAGAPADIGTLTRTGDEIHLRITPGVDARIAGAAITDTVLHSDIDPTTPADRVTIGERFTFFIIARGGRLGLRLYDRDAPARRSFTGVPSFPVHSAWQVPARFEAYAQPRTIDHPTILGTTAPAEVPGIAIFNIAGVEHRLTPILEKGPHGDELLFVFRDLTSGSETYAGGRFLVTPLPQSGSLVLDFNRAHNPPCAFTPYATCPVPLPENRLPLRVEAGERTPTEH